MTLLEVAAQAVAQARQEAAQATAAQQAGTQAIMAVVERLSTPADEVAGAVGPRPERTHDCCRTQRVWENLLTSVVKKRSSVRR